MPSKPLVVIMYHVWPLVSRFSRQQLGQFNTAASALHCAKRDLQNSAEAQYMADSCSAAAAATVGGGMHIPGDPMQLYQNLRSDRAWTIGTELSSRAVAAARWKRRGIERQGTTRRHGGRRKPELQRQSSVRPAPARHASANTHQHRCHKVAPATGAPLGGLSHRLLAPGARRTCPLKSSIA